MIIENNYVPKTHSPLSMTAPSLHTQMPLASHIVVSGGEHALVTKNEQLSPTPPSVKTNGSSIVPFAQAN